MPENYIVCYGPTLAQFVANMASQGGLGGIVNCDGYNGKDDVQVRGIAIPVSYWAFFWDSFEKASHFETWWDGAFFAALLVAPTAVRFVRALGGFSLEEKLSIAGTTGSWIRSSLLNNFTLPTSSFKDRLPDMEWPHIESEAQVQTRPLFLHGMKS